MPSPGQQKLPTVALALTNHDLAGDDPLLNIKKIKKKVFKTLIQSGQIYPTSNDRLCRTPDPDVEPPSRME